MTHDGLASGGFVLLSLEHAALEGSPDSGATLRGGGWVVAAAPVERLVVRLGEAVLGAATLGLARPDVAADFAHYPHAAHAGFSLALRLPPGVGPDAPLVLQARAGGGEALRRIVLARPSRSSRPEGPWPLRLDVDAVRLDAAGVLHVRGWVATLDGLEALLLSVNGRPLGAPELELPRPDVAARHGAYPDAARSGFRLSVACSGLEPGAALCVEARGRDGTRRRLLVPVALPPAAAPVPEPPPVPGAGPPPASVDPDGTPRMGCDAALLRPDGTVLVAGWAVGEGGVAGVDLLLDGVPLGEARCVLSRPDVGNRFPRLPGAATAGFRFHGPVPPVRPSLDAAPPASLAARGTSPASGPTSPVPPGVRASASPHRLTVRVREGSGASRRVELALRQGGGPAGTVTPALLLVLDPPFGGEEAVPVPGSLRLTGWVLPGAPSPAGAPEAGVESVEVLLDAPPADAGPVGVASGPSGSRLLSRAVRGLRREDVAAAHPERADAPLCGWAAIVPAGALPPGEHLLRVRARTSDGLLAERRVPVRVPAQRPATGAEAVRTRVPSAEAALGRAMLSRLCQTPPLVRVLVLLSDLSPSGREALAATLRGLAAQAHPGWRAALLPPDRDAAPPPWLPELLRDPALEERAAWHAAAPSPSAASGQDPDAAASPTHHAVLRAGDVLGADALLELLGEAALSGADLVFADERRPDPATGHPATFLKPGWSPDLLLAQNYVGRPWCATDRCWRAAAIEPARLPVLGEHDAVLRLAAAARLVRHLPGVLCERLLPAGDDPAQERRAVEAALLRQATPPPPAPRPRSVTGWSPGGPVAPSAMAPFAASAPAPPVVRPGRAPGTWSVRRPARPCRVSVILPTVGARGLVEAALRDLRERTDWPDLEVLCVTNLPAGEVPALRTRLAGRADRLLEAPGPFNWSRLNNLAARAATGELLLFLNDDVGVLEPGWLAALAAQAQRPEVGVAGAQLLYPDGSLQHAGLFFGPDGGRHLLRFQPGDASGPFGLAQCAREVLAVTGACMMLRRDTFERLGGFEERHAVVNNDVDVCLRARAAGLRVLYAPEARLVHHELASRALIPDIFDDAAFRAAWGALLLEGDPFRNPLLAAGTDDWTPEPEPARALVAGRPLLARGEVRRILALKLDHLGDFVAALPALRRLKERFPDAQLCVLAAGASEALARLEPAIDAVLRFDFFHVRSGEGERGVDASELAALEQALLPHRFDVAVDLRMHPDTRPVLRHTGARLLAGFDHEGRFPWLDVAPVWEGDPALQPKRLHVADRLLHLVEALSVACEPRPAPLRPLPAATPAPATSPLPVAPSAAPSRSSPAARTAAAIPAAAPTPASAPPMALQGPPPAPAASPWPLPPGDGPLVCVHPGVGNAIRQWPERHFAGLVDLLVAREGARVVLIGTAAEAAVVEAVHARVRHKDAVVSLAGRTTLAELPALLGACALFVGNNSGPQHVAAALGVPTVGVHSAVVDAVEWGPLGTHAAAVRREMACGPCYLPQAADCPRALACLEGLLPATVFLLCRRMLVLGRHAGDDAGGGPS